jgi:hypothetical protein
MPEALSPMEKIRAAAEAKKTMEAEAAAKLEADRKAAEAKEARRGELSSQRESAELNMGAAMEAAGAAKKEADEARTLRTELGADIDADTSAAF